MTIKDKLNFFVKHGMAIKYIAERMEVDPSTLSKWLRNEKGITNRNENRLNVILKEIAKELFIIMEDSYESN